MDIRQLIKGHRLATVSMAVSSTLGGLAEAAFLVLATRLALAVSDDADTVEWFGDRTLATRDAVLVALALVVVRLLLAVFSNRLAAAMAVRITADLRGELADAYLHASWRRQQDDRVGRLQELMTNYTMAGSNMVSGVSSAITAAFGLLAMLALAVAVHPVGALVVIGAVALLGLALRPVRSRIGRRSSETSDTGMAFATGLGEVATVGLELQVFGVQHHMGARVQRLIDEGQESNRRLVLLRGIVPHLYTALAFLALVGALAIASAADAGDVASLGAVMLVMLRSLSYGQQFQVSSAIISTSRPYLVELDEQIRSYRAEAVVDDGAPVGAVGAIELRDVHFSYLPDRPVLHGISATVQPNEVVGIVGPSGSGKSTLVQLLLGLRTPTSGAVLADGRPIDTLARSEWVRKVAFVPQASHLLRGTVADNIRFLRDHLDDAAVERAARLAHLHDEIVAFPDGYAHDVGEGGGRLSGGQQQRLCLARALAGDPEVLVLDEPTSALDARSEALVRETLAELAHRMTIVIVAHRISTLEVCDRIMVVQSGQLVAFDTPFVLQVASPAYRDITQTLEP